MSISLSSPAFGLPRPRFQDKFFSRFSKKEDHPVRVKGEGRDREIKLARWRG